MTVARYVIQPRAEVFDLLLDTPLLEGRTVFEREPINIGLVSKDGHSIYRTPEPIGFQRLNEKD